MLTGNSFVIKSLLQMYILFFLKRSFKFGVFFIVIGCSDQKNPESEIDKEIDSNRSTATEVIPVTFDSKDRKLDEILVDFDKPIETFPRITSAESYTDQAGITFRDGIEDPFTGRVLALSGGFSFKNSEFNRATQALRQPGSAFKPFVYALALENNYTPSSLVLDAPLVLDQGSELK